MARTNQRLINYHTSGATNMPLVNDVQLGEIVVRHNNDKPELLIELNNGKFAVFQASGAVQTAITTAVNGAKSELNTDISNLEKQLSAHTADFEAFQTEVETTYATKLELDAAESALTKNYTDAIATAKSEAIATASAYTKTQVDAAKNTLNGAIQTVESNLEQLSGSVESIVTNINNNFVTKESLEEDLAQVGRDISTAKDAAINSGKTYTDAQVAVAKGYTDTQIDLSESRTNGLIEGVASDVDELTKTVAANKKTVEDNYVLTTTLNSTVETINGNMSDAQKAATDASSAYTDAQIVLAKQYADTQINNAKSTIKQTTDVLNSKIDTLSGNVETTLDALEETLTEAINNKVSVAYRYQGSVDNYADLPKNLTTGETGYVYNVANANGNIPAGTNYAWNGTVWDALGGTVDLSPYAKTSDVNTTVNGINQRIQGIESSVGTLSGNTDSAIASLKQYADGTFATKIELQTAQNSITEGYTKAIASAKTEAIASASAYTDTQVLAAKNALNQTIQNVDGRVTSLSASTVSVKATADSAVQTVSGNCGTVATKTGTHVELNFNNLVIDCGDF